MIDKKIMDQILPVPDLEELRDQKVQELKDAGFVLTNFYSGGIFYHLMMISLKIKIELKELLRDVTNDTFVSHAREKWLELKAADFSRVRKQATKMQGYVVVSRQQPGEAIKFNRGHIFKTQLDINGDELRYFALADTVLQKDVLAVSIEVEAEKVGAVYNVPPGSITRSLLHVEGIDAIDNPEGWIIREGSDIEDYESLRSRTLSAWADLATQPIRDKYWNVCMAVPGVLYITVDDEHPRGQGTIDIIVTGTAGEATAALLAAVLEAAKTIQAPHDDLLIKSAVTVSQDISLLVTLPSSLNADGFDDKVASVIAEFMQINRARELNKLLHADLIHTVKTRLPESRNVKVLTPDQDLILDKDKVIIARRIQVDVQRV